ncbi:MAG: pyrroline-5-carboxylate reductase [Clostridia bacterium]|nr:pyrroline-5-carboxylate reductase [Clostridia bacterium]
MIRTIGMIGAGNMGSAILRGIVEAEYVRASQVIAFDTNRKRMRELEEDLPGISLAADCLEVAERADLIILAVKPIFVSEVIDQIKSTLNGKAVLSIAAGWTVSMLEKALDHSGATYMRVMPNTPALVGEGMTALCDESTFSKEDFDFVKGIFDAIGKTRILPERLFDGVVALSGSSPAYVYMMIEAMADAAVKEGIPRVHAYEMAAQSVLGSALMVLSTGTHPAALKDAVCSPGGTTIEAVEELERKGFRAAIMDAMKVCAEKSRNMSSK